MNNTRICGDCSACCYTHDVDVYNVKKPGFTTCEFLAGNGGCGIYSARPHSCRSFACAWLKGEVGSDNLRPHEVGLVTRIYPANEACDTAIIEALEYRDGAAASDIGQALINELHQRGFALCVVSLSLPKGYEYHIHTSLRDRIFVRSIIQNGTAVVWYS